MQYTLDYGRGKLTFQTDPADVVSVLNIREMSSAADQSGAIWDAILNPIGTRPLADLATGKTTACIVVCDITRPVPNPVILPILLQILREQGIPAERVTILNATGTHRPNTEAELRQMLGDEAYDNCRIVNHVCTEEDRLRYLGESPNGVPIYLNTEYLDADLKITVGMIEPHFMAGYAGGRKMVMPGVAGLKSVQAWHSPRFLEHPLATNGSYIGNPVHEEATWIASQARPDFIIDVVLDRQKRVVTAFAGDMVQAWERGVAFVSEFAQDTTPTPVDVVVTSGGGYPLDLTFYQTVKGMVGALPVLAEDGAIVIASACEEGPGNNHFRDCILDCPDITKFLEQIEAPDWEFVPDQWQVEEFAKAARSARIYLKSELPRDLADRMFVRNVTTIEEALAELRRERGRPLRIAVIPKGPYVIARVLAEA